MIKIIDGDLFDSKAGVIAHQVNCQGAMNSGVAKQIRQKYPKVFKHYIKYYRNFPLGACQIIEVNSNLSIANMFAQDKYGYDGKQYTSYDALKSCFMQLYKYAKFKNYTIAMPYKVGCVRGGANWDKVYSIMKEIFTDVDVELWRLDNG